MKLQISKLDFIYEIFNLARANKEKITTKFYTFYVKVYVEREEEERKKNYQGSLVSAWNAFLLNVNSMGYLRG